MAGLLNELDDLRSRILENPRAILEDKAVMRALVEAESQARSEEQGLNVVDLKSVVLNKLEDELNEVQEQTETVISAAYENMSTTDHIHRAVLDLVNPIKFTDFLRYLESGLAASLNVDVAKVCMETPHGNEAQLAALEHQFGNGIIFLHNDEIDYYITLGLDVPIRPITLRQVRRGINRVHDDRATDIRSEALLKLDLGPGNRPGLLVLASTHEDQFRPDMATDLLEFYKSVFEKIVQRWLTDD